jgi:dethiobiotin synthetase
MTSGWFVTGTDTGVGKTQVSEALLRALAHSGRRAVGMKPVASGCHRSAAGLRSEDAECLQAASSVPADYIDVNPYAFEPPIAPQLAAESAGARIELGVIERHYQRLAATADVMVVEGIGGWRVPLGPSLEMSGVAQSLRLPVVLVVGARLGCISHSLLTAESIRADGCVLAGWAVNQIDPAFETSAELIQLLHERIGVPPLAVIGYRPARDAWQAHGATMLARLLG